VEYVTLKTPDDPIIREVTTRMSRFVCGLETEQERGKEKAYVVESDFPLVLSRYTPDKVTADKNVYLTTACEKNGSRIFLVPGVIALIMFFSAKGDERTAEEARKMLQDYFVKRIEGSCAEGNDILINKRKVMGITVYYNPVHNLVMIRFVLTLKAGYIAGMAGELDFADRKYKGITGVCDETGLREETVRAIVSESIDFVLAWRPENADNR
jgi:hypothetical protein